jgi:hypothetical protein
LRPPSPPSLTADASLSPGSQPACASTTALFLAQYPHFDPSGCDPAFVQTVQQTYNCSEIAPGCGSYYCTVAIPPAVAAALGQCSQP